MKRIEEVFKEKSALITGEGASEKLIKSAEKELGLRFAEEYRTYLSLYGIAACDGHELTGLTKSLRVNVVAVTKEQRGNNPEIPQTLYVLEEMNIEGIIVWQSTSGRVYYSSPNGSLVKICDSMSEYINR